MSKYLSTRLCVESQTSTIGSLNPSQATSSNNTNADNSNDFQLFISSNEKLANSFKQLDQNLPLEQVIDKYWKLNRPVELFYFNLKPASQNANNHNGNELNGNSHSSNSCSSSSSSSSNGSWSLTSIRYIYIKIHLFCLYFCMKEKNNSNLRIIWV